MGPTEVPRRGSGVRSGVPLMHADCDAASQGTGLHFEL